MALLTERAKSIRAALEATVDAAVVASMEAEAAQLRAESAEIDSELALLAGSRTELDAAEDELAHRWAAFEVQWDGGVRCP